MERFSLRRILFLTDSLIAGGTEQQLVELVTRIDRQCFEPHIVCLYADRAGRSLHFLEALEAAQVPVHLLNLGWSYVDKLRAIVEIIRIVWRIRPSLIHAVNYHGSLLMRLARPCLPPSLKLISSVYVPYTQKQLLYERLSSWLCAAIVCNSEAIRQQLLRAHVVAPIELIPNGVDLKRFGSTLDTEPHHSRGRILLCIGRISIQKSPHLIVEALGRLKQKQRSHLPFPYKLLIVGERDGVAAQRLLESIVRRWQLEDVVLQLPATNLPHELYHIADITVLASLSEGLPNVVLESLAVGKPVVVSVAANADRLICHGTNGWVFETGDVNALAEILDVVITMDRAKLNAMREDCKASAMRYDVSQMVSAYEELYERLTSDR